MANIYEENENITLEDCENFRRTLRTPENQMIDRNLYDNSYRNFDNYPKYSELLPSTPANSAIDNFVQLSENLDDIPVDHTEFQIIDSYSCRKRPPRQNEFLELLLENSIYSSYVRWLDKKQGLFEILLPNQIVTLWEKVKSRQTNGKMNYQTFSRGLRYYYKTGVMIKTHKKYTFRFNRSTNNIPS
jgi:hypothetical protein